jgi:uncharacterized SAM-binding protein YcdF (DUF218 family)
VKRSRGLGSFSILLVVLVVALAIWLARAPLLVGVGALFVEDDSARRADAIVVVSSHPAIAALEAAALFRGGYAPRALVLAPPPDADDRALARLRIALPLPHERAALVMSHAGVPRTAIAIEPGGDGTNSDVRAVARWATRAHVRALIVVADRSHTRRIATLLRGRLPTTTIVMKSARDDGFDETRWWRDRSMSREVVMESLRWVNSVWLGDLFARDDRAR